MIDPAIDELPVHPLAALFPMLPEAELAELAEDIRANGQRFPIMLDSAGEVLIDGRNRRAACKLAGLPPSYARLAEDQDVLAFVISANLARRHLTESQRAMVAAKVATLRDGQRSDLVEGLPIGRAAELLSVSERSVARAAGVRRDGIPELVGAVERGEIKVSTAADIATLPVAHRPR